MSRWPVGASQTGPVLGVTATFWRGACEKKKQLQENGKGLCGGLLQWQMGAMEVQRIKQPVAGLSILIFHLSREGVRD